MDIDLLADAYGGIGFPFFAADLGDLAAVAEHPRASEGCHVTIQIEGVMPERRPAVAAALGRIMQQITVAPAYATHFASSNAIARTPGLAAKLLALTRDPNPAYRMSVVPEQIYWEELSPWPAAYGTFLGQLAGLTRTFGLLIAQRRGVGGNALEQRGLASSNLRILDQTSRVLPTRFHYAAASLGAWGGGTVNLQFLAFAALSTSLADSTANRRDAEAIGYDPDTARAVAESGLIAVSPQTVRAVLQAQGDNTAFGGTSVDEWNVANLPDRDASTQSAADADGYLIDKHYRTTFRAREPRLQALYGAQDVMRDHYDAFYRNVSIDGLLRCKHYCVPVVDVGGPAELAAIAGEIPIRSDEGVFFRGQTTLYPLQRDARVKGMLFGTSTSLEPSLGTSAARRNVDYDQLHFALRHFIQDHVIFGTDAAESADERRRRWRERSQSPQCEIDYAIMALAQHYGLPTHGLDVTSSIDIAVWFATNLWKNADGAATYRKKPLQEWGDDPSRWPVVFACQQVTHSLGMSLQRCRELDEFGLAALRPQRQHASFFHGGHSDHQNRLAETIVCAFRLKPGEWSTDATYETLFPRPEEDPAYAAMLVFADTPAYRSVGAGEVARYVYPA